MVLLIFSALFTGCAHTRPMATGKPVYSKVLHVFPEEAVRAESLYRTVEELAEAGGNGDRFAPVAKRASEMGLGDYFSSEPINAYTPQKNILIEIPGETDRLIYLVAHYDKSGLNPFSYASNMLNAKELVYGGPPHPRDQFYGP